MSIHEKKEVKDFNPLTPLCQHAWNKSFYAFATAHIFERRCEKYRRYLQILTFLGIGVPMLVGGIVLAFGLDNGTFPLFILSIALIFSIGQLVFSLWSLVARWPDQLGYALESSWTNHNLSSRYKALASSPQQDLLKFRQQLDMLDIENDQRERLDYQQGITEAEKRMGHRAGLRQFGRACTECGKIPDSLEASYCSTCGKF